MKIKSVELETVCGITSKLPENDKMEIAFAGKSNVGKSSLINGLLNRKSLARTSSSPGKTQTITLFCRFAGIWICKSFNGNKRKMGQNDRAVSEKIRCTCRNISSHRYKA